MKLVSVRVTNFKCVLDSERFSIANLTCLVGRNESGKTALLEALEKLKAADSDRQNFTDTDYPRMHWSAYNESDRVDVALHTDWTVDAEEIDHITNLGGCEDVLQATTVIVTKDYKNALHWDIKLDYAKCVATLIAAAGLTATERKPLAKVSTTDGLIKALRGIATPTAGQSKLLTKLMQRFPNGNLKAEVQAYLAERLPTFLYYSTYDRLPGQIALNELVAAQADGLLDRHPGVKIFIALLAMVGTTPMAIQNITTSESLIARLEAVENQLSRRIFKYWTQNKHLAVNFRFDEASPNDPAPFNAGKVFRTRIRNNRHQVSIGLDERSSGFIWFFSFLVWFSEVQRQHGDNLLVLLDEPGLTLHARAQSDLLRFIKEELLPNYQVIYTTHSPFMIDAEDLLSCRTVEDATGADDEVLGTKVGDDVLSTDTDTLFPLQAALGYDLTQTLFVGEHCLLVEGPSDLLYLQWFSSELARRRRVSLDPRWTITPCGGIAKVSSFMSLFGGSRLHVAVLEARPRTGGYEGQVARRDWPVAPDLGPAQWAAGSA